MPEAVRPSWSQLGDKMPKWEPATDRGLWALRDPRLSNPSQDEKEVLLWSEELGSICSRLSPSPTHLSHTTNISPFENKFSRIFFYKEVCSFFHWSRHYCWLCFRLYLYYVYVCGYTTYSYLVPKASSRPHGVILNLSLTRRSKKRPKGKSGKKCNNSRTNETRKERRKMDG